MPYRIEFTLTKEQALFIKDLRVTKDYSWRAVARDVSGEYPELGVSGSVEYNMGNQIDGIALCDAAMKLLGESIEDGWN
jgi:hypothetical protein